MLLSSRMIGSKITIMISLESWIFSSLGSILFIMERMEHQRSNGMVRKGQKTSSLRNLIKLFTTRLEKVNSSRLMALWTLLKRRTSKCSSKVFNILLRVQKLQGSQAMRETWRNLLSRAYHPRLISLCLWNQPSKGSCNRSSWLSYPWDLLHLKRCSYLQLSQLRNRRQT